MSIKHEVSIIPIRETKEWQVSHPGYLFNYYLYLSDASLIVFGGGESFGLKLAASLFELLRWSGVLKISSSDSTSRDGAGN